MTVFEFIISTAGATYLTELLFRLIDRIEGRA